MNKIDDLNDAHAGSPAAYARAYLDYLATCFDSIDCAEIERFVQLLLDVRKNDRTVFFIGNGGSAATASHFANDLSIGTRTGGDSPFRTVSLTDNMAVITALANDEGYESIFTDQLKVQMRAGDSVVAISASGNSPNIIAAVDYAKTRNATIVGLTGFDGGALRDKSDISLHVQTARGEYGPVEDIHMIFDHLIGSYLIALVKREAMA
ncbi:MAG: SIS domain-containing protein [Rhodospirillaceae bacterium]|jgi:D-sedoheptulose 7-phosphate isomerase|nr:SIS domain-containing protein [Rhodospirillaceae bacterium]MBT5459386.1 SIS domain-containing protein [Rhodospirillaceae bacterium]